MLPRNPPAALALLLPLVAALACGPARGAPSPPRLGVPPALETTFNTAPWPQGARWGVVGLRPYARAHDLEVLLFSTRSRAFDGLVVQARFIPLFARWSEPYPAELGRGLAPDLARAVESPRGLTALPLTADGPVLLYREAWWREHAMPPPSALAGLREDLLFLRSWRPGLAAPLQSAVPETLLLWSLSASYEGEVFPAFYRDATVQALGLMKEFGLHARDPRAVWEDLAKGRSGAAFLMASDAARLAASTGGGLAAVPLPSAFGAIAVNDGWCLMGTERRATPVLEALLSRDVQTHLARRGHFPASSAVERPAGAAFEALARTRLVGVPVVWEDEVVLAEAIDDALEGGVDPEAALRRAEARRTRPEAAP